MIEHTTELSRDYWHLQRPWNMSNLTRMLRRELESAMYPVVGTLNDEQGRQQVQMVLEQKLSELRQKGVIHDSMVQRNYTPPSEVHGRMEHRLDVFVKPVASIEQIHINVTLS